MNVHLRFYVAFMGVLGIILVHSNVSAQEQEQELAHEQNHLQNRRLNRSPYHDITPHLFQGIPQNEMNWKTTDDSWKIGLGYNSSQNSNQIYLHREYKTVHAIEGIYSFYAPIRTFTFRYLFNLSAYTAPVLPSKKSALWCVAGASFLGTHAAFRYTLSHHLPVQLWMEHGLAYTFENHRIKSHLNAGVLYTPSLFLAQLRKKSSSKNIMHKPERAIQNNTDEIRIWGGAVYRPSTQMFGSNWNIALKYGQTPWSFIQPRGSLDYFRNSTIMHLALDFSAPLFPSNALLQTYVAISPEWQIEQSPDWPLRSQLGFSLSLSSMLTTHDIYHPYVQLQLQTAPEHYYRIGWGVRIAMQAKNKREVRWFSDLAECLIGIPNLGLQLRPSDQWEAEIQISSAWFEIYHETHRFQAVRITGLASKKKLLSLTPSAHMRILQYDFGSNTRGEMGKGWEAGLGISKELSSLNARIQIDVGWLKLWRRPYTLIHGYPVKGPYSNESSYWGPTAIRYIQYWGKNSNTQFK